MGRTLLLVFSLVTLPAAAGEPELCRSLRDFGNAASPDKPVRVSLVADWQDFSKRCESSEIPEASRLCNVLLPKLVRSFVHTAAREAVACFPDLQPHALGPHGGLQRAEVKLSSRALGGTREDVHVSVSYLVGSEVDGQWLTIVAAADPE
jgi:hypothetical protein